MDENQLLVSHVPRSLEAKSKIFGLELGDVLVLFLNLSIQNLVFGSTHAKSVMVYGTTLVLGFVLFFVKKGKPDSYLQHLAQYTISPSVHFAGLNDREYQNFKNEGGAL